MGFLRSLSAVALLAGLVAAQEDDRPYKPTVDSLQMAGSGCPIGAAGIMSGMESGTPIFKFLEWDLDLNDLEEDPVTGEMADTIDKFCIEQVKLGNSPPGYQARIKVVNIGGKAKLEEGSVLGVLVQTRFDEQPSGEGETYVEAGDLDDGSFSVSIEPKGDDMWSDCVGEDGVVPTMHITTTLALWREGSEDSAGSVGSPDGDMDSALTVHFESAWRKCE